MTSYDVDAIASALSTSPVYVEDGAGSWIDTAAVTELDSVITDGEVPLFVVLVPPDEDGGIYSGQDLLTRVHDAVVAQVGPEDAAGLYVGVNNVWTHGSGNDPYADGSTFNLASVQFGQVAGSSDLTWDIEQFLSYGADDGTTGEPFELGPGLVAVAEHLAAGDADTLAATGEAGWDVYNEQRPETSTAESGSGTSADDFSAGALVLPGALVLALVAVVVAVVAVRRRRTDARRSRAKGTFELPEAAVARVREAEGASLTRRARAATLALGERIESSDIGAGDDTTAWQAALDHYEAANRVLGDDDSSPDLINAVGAIVLADRGEQALDAVRRRRALTFRTPCFLNPLHSSGTKEHRLTHGGTAIDAPLCAECRKALAAGKRPAILDVMVDGHAQHYFETDLQPWAATGFGALDEDLLTRLRTR